MKIQKTSTSNDPKNTPTHQSFSNVNTDLTQIQQAINGNIRFGDGTSGQNGENLSGQWVTFVTSGTANSAFVVNHTIGATPIGYIVTSINKGGVIYTSGTNFTPSTVNFECTVSSATATVFLLR